MAGGGGPARRRLVVHRHAVGHYHALEREDEERTQSRERALLVPRGRPHAKLAVGCGESVREDERTLLREPQRRLVASPPVVEGDEAAENLALPVSTARARSRERRRARRGAGRTPGPGLTAWKRSTWHVTRTRGRRRASAGARRAESRPDDGGATGEERDLAALSTHVAAEQWNPGARRDVLSTRARDRAPARTSSSRLAPAASRNRNCTWASPTAGVFKRATTTPRAVEMRSMMRCALRGRRKPRPPKRSARCPTSTRQGGQSKTWMTARIWSTPSG